MRFDHPGQTHAFNVFTAVFSGFEIPKSKGGIRTKRELVKTILSRKEWITQNGGIVEVICDGNKHKIAMDKNKLRLLHHSEDDIRRRRAIEEMGGDLCRCVKILNCWKAGEIGPLPQLFNTLRRRTWELSVMRVLNVNPKPIWPPNVKDRPKWLLKVEPTVERILRSRCEYEMLTACGGHVLMISGGHVYVEAKGGLIPNDFKYPRYALAMRLPTTWWDRCFKYGGFLKYQKDNFFLLDLMGRFALVLIETKVAGILKIETYAIEVGIHGNRAYPIKGKSARLIENAGDWENFLRRHKISLKGRS